MPVSTTGKFSPNIPSTPTSTIVAATGGRSATCRKAARSWPGAGATTARAGARPPPLRPSIEASEQAAVAAKTQPVPAVPMRVAATAGPTSRVIWKTAAASATAGCRHAGGTISVTNTCRVGFSTTRTSPPTSARTSTWTAWTVPVSVSTARDRGDRGVGGRGGEQQRAARRRSARSPPCSPSSEHGQELAGHRDADRGGAARQLQDEPVLGDRAHPRAGGGGGVAGEVGAEGGGTERGERGRGHGEDLSSWSRTAPASASSPGYSEGRSADLLLLWNVMPRTTRPAAHLPRRRPDPQLHPGRGPPRHPPADGQPAHPQARGGGRPGARAARHAHRSRSPPTARR